MTQMQKIIKYVAISFAFLLIITIVSAILGILSFFFSGWKDDVILDTEKEILVDSPTELEIDVRATNIIIENGDTFTVKTNNAYITNKEQNGRLIIKEKKHHSYLNEEKAILKIQIPTRTVLNELDMNAGAGTINITSITTNKLDIELGAGKAEINNITVLKEASIEGGAGELIINDGSFHNLDLEVGVGSTSLTTQLLGNTNIESGMGEIKASLIGTKEDYRIYAEKGIGSIQIDGQSLKNNTPYGEGKNIVHIEGGIGAIAIQFKESQKIESSKFQLEIEIKDYLKNEQNKTILLGSILSGNPILGEVKLYDKENEWIATALIKDYYTTIKDQEGYNQVILDIDTTEENLRKTTKIVIP